MERRFINSIFTSILTISMLAVAAFAQTSPVRGKVVMIGADGKEAPVIGATVETYRTDINSKGPTAKTDKRGEFVFAGLQIGGVYTLAISGTGLEPLVYPGVKAGAEGITITVSSGDGRKLTGEEVRNSTAKVAKTGGSETGLSEADKKKLAEDEAKLNAVKESNKKIEDKNKLIETLIKEANEAYAAKNYDVAVVKYKEGFDADPEFLGSAPIFLNYRAYALRSRAVITYNSSIKATDVQEKLDFRAKVKQDLADAIEGQAKAYQLLSGSVDGGGLELTKIDSMKKEILKGSIETVRLTAATEAVSPERIEDMRTLITTYIGVETDANEKVKAQTAFADIFRAQADSPNAIAEYRKALLIVPNYPEALGGLGLSLMNNGYMVGDTTPEGKAQMQEGLDVMAHFVEIAPVQATDNQFVKSLKESVKGAVDYLKSAGLVPKKMVVPKGVIKRKN